MTRPRPHLALVEDSDDDFVLLSRVFGPETETIHRWASGEEALEAMLAAGRAGSPQCADDVPILVLVDLHLPGIDGCEVIRRIRALDGGGRPVICMLTTSRRTTDRDRAREAGADGYLVKPTDLRGLRQLPGQVAEIAAAR